MKEDILFVHDYPPTGGGGVEVNTYNLAKNLYANGHSVTIFSSRAESETFKYNGEKSDDVNIVTSQDSSILEEAIKNHTFTVVLCTFSLRPGMMKALEVLSENGLHHIAYIRTNYSHTNFSRLSRITNAESMQDMNKFASYLQNDNCHIVGVSKTVEDSLSELEINKPATIIHPGINWTELSPTEKPTDYDLCFIGEMAANKGVYMLPYAMISLKKAFPDLKTLFIGEGDQKEPLQALCRLLKIDDRVSFTGYIDRQKVNEYLNSSKVLVHPSLSESWGNVLVEALGLERELVASNIEGCIEVAKLSPLVQLFTPGDIEDMSAKIISALTDYDKNRGHRKKIASDIRNLITVDQQRIELLELIASIRQ